MVVVLQALLDRHAMLRLRVEDDGAGGWSLQVPEPGSVDAGDCLHIVDELSDEALVAARSRLNPAAGVMLSALWVADTGQLVLIVHHLAVDAVSWRILLEDLNIAWAQHHSGQPIALPVDGNVVCAGGRRCWPSTRRPPAVVEQADDVEAGGGGTGRAAGGAARRSTPTPAPGTCRCRWTPRPPGCCSVRCLRRFTPGCRTSC